MFPRSAWERTIAAPRRDQTPPATARRKSSVADKIRDAFLQNANKNEVAELAATAASADSQKTGVFLSIRDSDLKKPRKMRVGQECLAGGKGALANRLPFIRLLTHFRWAKKQEKGTDRIGSLTSIARLGGRTWLHAAEKSRFH